MEYKILVVDDESDLREILQCNLENAGYQVETAESAEEALQKLTPDCSLILLDVMLGGMSGFKLAEKLRKDLKNNVPIIFLTARDTENDMLTGFSSGGDDYISKPFSLQEVLVRIKAILRRTSTPKAKAKIEIGAIEIDFERKMVTVRGEDIHLSPKEFGIFRQRIPSVCLRVKRYFLKCGVAKVMFWIAPLMFMWRESVGNWVTKLPA